MRILHLAYEDPRQPNSGGGSVRTLEINRRLAERHDITCVVAGYPGAKERREHGIHWIPLRSKTGTMLDRLAYFAQLGPEARRHRFDLLVEDFGAPFSVGFSPVFTRKPVIASVQWLFASQMRDKYRLPFHWVERSGLRYYHRFITVSDWLRDVIVARCPQADVDTVPNGVEDVAFATSPGRASHLLFLGRLDIEQKGADLLLEIMARARRIASGTLPPLLIAGDGPDRPQLEQRIRQFDLEDLVRFVGRVSGPEKYQLMADSHAVLMPSRFETFGMVAVEAQASCAPVIAFDVGPLSEVAGGGRAVLVKPFDLDAFAKQVVHAVEGGEQAAIRQAGRTWARRYRWDELAVRQESIYRKAVEC